MKTNHMQGNNNVTVIGLGAMGTALATAFISKGVHTTVWNRSPEKAAPLVSKGAQQAAQIGEAIDASSLIIVCLLTYDTVYEALQPAASQLKGKTLVNLTNGTPQQARDFAKWAASKGAMYVDGGIMAVPPMIGSRESLILYSGSKEAFDTWQYQLDILGTSQFVGQDAGLAPLYDISLLTGMYGMFCGGLQAMALITSEKLSAQQFMLLLKPWLQAMLSQVEIMASEIDKGDYFEYVQSPLGMQAAAYGNLIETSKAQGLSAELVTPLHHLFQRAVEAGYSTGNVSALVEVIRKPEAR